MGEEIISLKERKNRNYLEKLFVFRLAEPDEMHARLLKVVAKVIAGCDKARAVGPGSTPNLKSALPPTDVYLSCHILTDFFGD